MQTAETASTPEQSEAKENKLFAEHVDSFNQTEQALAACRAFIEKHKGTLQQLNGWRAYGFSAKIIFDYFGQRPPDIAKAFGATGWTRKANQYSCGSIDWHKEMDGMELVIEGAESIKPTLREEVKLS